MLWDQRRDLRGEIRRTYIFPKDEYVVQFPVAVYWSPGRDVEGVLDSHGRLHVLPAPGLVPIRIDRAPDADEPLYDPSGL